MSWNIIAVPSLFSGLQLRLQVSDSGCWILLQEYETTIPHKVLSWEFTRLFSLLRTAASNSETAYNVAVLPVPGFCNSQLITFLTCQKSNVLFTSLSGFTILKKPLFHIFKTFTTTTTPRNAICICLFGLEGCVLCLWDLCLWVLEIWWIQITLPEVMVPGCWPSTHWMDIHCSKWLFQAISELKHCVWVAFISHNTQNWLLYLKGRKQKRQKTIEKFTFRSFSMLVAIIL